MNAYDFTLMTVKQAGEMVMRLRKEKFKTLAKGGNPRDIVTSVDLEVNDFLIKAIREAFPGDAIYSEEGADEITSAPRLWALDPIDGSSNFSRSIPHFAVCMALLENGTPTVGVVYNPVTDELFSFEKGKGAFLNGDPIRVSEEKELKNAFVFIHAGRRQEFWEWGGNAYVALLKHAKKTSNHAGSALDLCFVAAGRIEANVYGTISLLDVAAAAGILREAGGVIVNEAGEPLELLSGKQRMYSANSTEMADQIRAIL